MPEHSSRLYRQDGSSWRDGAWDVAATSVDELRAVAERLLDEAKGPAAQALRSLLHETVPALEAREKVPEATATRIGGGVGRRRLSVAALPAAPLASSHAARGTVGWLAHLTRPQPYQTHLERAWPATHGGPCARTVPTAQTHAAPRNGQTVRFTNHRSRPCRRRSRGWAAMHGQAHHGTRRVDALGRCCL